MTFFHCSKDQSLSELAINSITKLFECKLPSCAIAAQSLDNLFATRLWNFLQVWTADFLSHHPHDGSIAIWTESYGGRYGPSFAAHILEQNARIKKGRLPGAKPLNLTTLGIVNGCVDLLLHESSYPQYAYDRNPYGIKGVTHAAYTKALEAYSKKGGCLDQMETCLHLEKTLDPQMYGNVDKVNGACKNASDYCQNEIEGPFMFRKKYAYYDITHCYLDPSPPNRYLEYLAQEHVLQALGVPVNYTDASNAVVAAFNKTGDYARRNPRGNVESIAELLDAGIHVSMLYGDSDFACNWIGGERTSLAVKHSQADAFSRAGYADVVLDGAQSPGQVRQHGSFSFVRVYHSGHMVPYSQPRAAFELLRRVMHRKDVATGQVLLSRRYSTNGTFRSTKTLKMPPAPAVTCHTRAMASTCAENQVKAVQDGNATIAKGIVVKPEPAPGTCAGFKFRASSE
ncbi:hypothetical protein HIM_03116 [Hirsutella minnesotensis 3608]|nr:hypothetical protein HIM_03116 [Hirsutella minnesotensis 3608]